MAQQGATDCREIFPIRQAIRRHYKKMRGCLYARCNHCLEPITSRPQIYLHNHLVEEHSNELTEAEKEDKRTHWTWDHVTIKDTQNVTCNRCDQKIKCNQKKFDCVCRHLKTVHGILPPCTDDVDNMSSDAHANTTIKIDEIHSATSSKITEQIGVLNKSVPSTESTDYVLDLSLHKDVTKH